MNAITPRVTLFLAVFTLMSCAATPAIIEVDIIVTQTPEPTLTASPSPTATVTPTPRPTNTRRPTNTPRPTATRTPRPTQTPVPEPMVFEGTGDQIVDVAFPEILRLLRVTGNAARRHFAVTSYDRDNGYIELHINTTDAYTGLRLLRNDEIPIARLEVKATGPWTIEVLPFTLDYVPSFTLPGTKAGVGDSVLYLFGGPPDLFALSTTQSKHIAIYAWSKDGRRLIANDVGPYSGTSLLPVDTMLLEIDTDGDWNIEITKK